MDKHRILTELFLAMHTLSNMEHNEETHGLIIDNIWIAVKEICEIKAEGRFDNKVLEYVLEILNKTKVVDEDPYGTLIKYLTTSKIEMNEDIF